MSKSRTPIADKESLIKFDELVLDHGTFWSDLFTLQKATGLRNVDVRNLTWDCINFESYTVTVTESKQSLSKLTKATNKRLDALWLEELEMLVQDYAEQNGKDRFIYQAEIAETETQLVKIAKKLAVTDTIETAKIAFYEAHKPTVEADIKRSGTAKHKARVISLGKNKKACEVLKLRKELYENRSDLVFSAITLDSNRACNDSPCSRQSVYKVMQKIQLKLEAWRIEKTKLTGMVFQAIRLGCHSMRKTAATLLYRATKDIAMVSKWIGHSDPITTVRYIGLDEQTIQDADDILADEFYC